jgi:hypothetical protein
MLLSHRRAMEWQSLPVATDPELPAVRAEIDDPVKKNVPRGTRCCGGKLHSAATIA